MRNQAAERQALLDAWPVASPFDLLEMVGGVGNRLLSAVSTRQELVRMVRFNEDLADRNERILIAMGNLAHIDQGAQKNWWGFVQNDVELIHLAVKAKLHTRYMLPSDTSQFFEGWMEKGGGFHKAANLVWDQAVSGYAHPFILEGVMDPIEFNQAHMDHWKSRVVECWSHAPPQAKAAVVSLFLINGTPPFASDPGKYVARKRWIMRWAEELLDGSETTIGGVREGLARSLNLTSRLDEQLVGVFQSHIDAMQIEQSTHVSTSSAAPRTRL